MDGGPQARLAAQILRGSVRVFWALGLIGGWSETVCVGGSEPDSRKIDTSVPISEFPTSPAVLTGAAAVNAWRPSAETKSRQVQLRGVVTVFDRMNGCYLQDHSAGVYVRLKRQLRYVTRGDFVEIEGRWDMGNFAPVVTAERLRVLDSAELPAAQKAAYSQLASGKFNAMCAEISGILRSAQHTKQGGDLLVLGMEGGLVDVYLGEEQGADYSELIDAEVSIRGVASGRFLSGRKQMIAPVLRASRRSDIVVDEPAPGNPFAAAARRATNLFQFSPANPSGHRVKVEGIVTHYEPGRWLFVRDGAHGLR
ncbi:MAG: hypothetical protein ACREH8_00150, partial [Opitutaceae bacterium]